MVINELNATFGALDNKTLALTDGLNVIYGKNEAGKSTWSAFIRVMLYGVDTQKRTELADKNRYQPWSLKPMQGTMEITLGGRKIVITRSSAKDKPMQTVQAYYKDSGQPADFLNGDMGQQILGIGEGAFSQSAFIAQSQIEVHQQDELERRIQAAASSGDEQISYTATAKNLKEMRAQRKSGNTRGQIPELENRLAVLKTNLAAIKDTNEKITQINVELNLLTGEYKALEAQLSAASAQSAKARLENLTRLKAGYKTALDDLEQNKARLRKVAFIGEIRPERDALLALQAECDSAARELNAAKAGLNEEAKKLANYPGAQPEQDYAQTISQDMSNARAAKKRTNRLDIILYCAALALAACSPFFGYWLLLPPAGLLLVTGLLLTVLSAKNAVRVKDFYAKYQIDSIDAAQELHQAYTRDKSAFDAQAGVFNNAKARHAQAVQRLEVQQAKLLALLSAHGIADMEALKAVDFDFGKYASLEKHYNDEYNLAAARLEQHDVSDEELETLARQATNSGHEATEGDPAELQAQLTGLGTKIAQLRSDEAYHKGQLGEKSSAELHSQIGQAQQDLERAYFELEAIDLAAGALDRANEEMLARFAPQLSKCAFEIFCTITGADYHSLILRKGFEAFLTTQGDQAPKKALFLSGGTIEQLYLAIRLALCLQVLPEENPCFIVLDDALVYFDDNRARLALEYLCQLAEKRQIILFTCHRREQQLLQELAPEQPVNFLQL